MSRQIINVTDITEYLYCPRKVYLRLSKGIRSPPSKIMILGSLRHKALELFSKNEQTLVSSIIEKPEESKIKKLYSNMASGITREIFSLNENLAGKFGITEAEFKKSVSLSLEPEIAIRIPAIMATAEKGFLSISLWKELEPKYISELKLESPELGIRGRVDRVQLAPELVPFEVKTRDRVYESDKIQLAAYSLLLEKEFNQPVSSGVVEFLGKHEKIELTPELKARVLEIADKIRSMTEETAEFPSNFEKCRNCMLKENCG